MSKRVCSVVCSPSEVVGRLQLAAESICDSRATHRAESAAHPRLSSPSPSPYRRRRRTLVQDQMFISRPRHNLNTASTGHPACCLLPAAGGVAVFVYLYLLTTLYSPLSTVSVRGSRLTSRSRHSLPRPLRSRSRKQVQTRISSTSVPGRHDYKFHCCRSTSFKQILDTNCKSTMIVGCCQYQ